MKTLLLIITGIILCIHSYTQNSEILENDVLIRKHFSKKDIKNLNKILLFFDQIVKTECEDTSKIENCYRDYCEAVKLKAETGTIDLNFSYKNQKVLLDDMDKSTFDKIWSYTHAYRTVNGKKVQMLPETIELLYKSPYMNLCKDISLKNPNLKFYYETYQTAGTMNSDMIELVFENHEQFDFTKAEERLMIAVHYLTVNSRFYEN